MSLRAETEMAMKLLEKDIHEKQDTIVSLRRQLEDIKQINLEMYNKLQVMKNHLKFYFGLFVCFICCLYSFTFNSSIFFGLHLSFLSFHEMS